MFRSHLAGLGDDTTPTATADSPIIKLGTPPQTLPTNGIESLVSMFAVPVPTSPASPLTVQAVQPLAVLDQNQVPGPADTVLINRATMPSKVAPWLLFAVAGGLIWWISRKK